MADEIIRIDQLDATASVLADHMFPAMRNGETIRISAEQLATFIIAIMTGTAPATLDTITELAAALGDDPDFAATVMAQLALKASLTGSETLTNKILTSPIINSPTLNLKSASPLPTALGDIRFDGTALIVGDGTAQVTFRSTKQIERYLELSTSSPTMQFIDLGACRNVEISGRWKLVTAGNTATLRLSSDNGNNFINGPSSYFYQYLRGDGAAANASRASADSMPLSLTGEDTSLGTAVELKLQGLNQNEHTTGTFDVGSVGAAGYFVSYFQGTNVAAVHNALRFTAGGAGGFAAGSYLHLKGLVP